MIEGLTQFLTQSPDASPQIAEDKSICGTAGFEGGFCATLFRTARKSLILKRRDVRVVEGACLESGAGQRHRAALKRGNAHVISDLTSQTDHSVYAHKRRRSSRL